MGKHIYYNEVNIPTAIRIQSEKLCLDYVFLPSMAENVVTCQDLQQLSKSKVLDTVMVYFAPDSAYYKEELQNCIVMHKMAGWKNIKQYEIHNIREFYESREYLDAKKSCIWKQ